MFLLKILKIISQTTSNTSPLFAYASSYNEKTGLYDGLILGGSKVEGGTIPRCGGVLVKSEVALQQVAKEKPERIDEHRCSQEVEREPSCMMAHQKTVETKRPILRRFHGSVSHK
jgi:hypothetical protein